jgi:hypothetical protein
MVKGALLKPADTRVEETPDRITIETPYLSAAVTKRGYVSGVAGGSFLDKQTGFRDAGFGLDIVDWIMESGSDEAYRDRLTGDLKYEFNNLVHGWTPKRCIEGPQICTQAKELSPEVIRGKDFVAIEQSYKYRIAAPGKKSGSLWEQTLVFPAGKRYFLSSDRMAGVNSGNLFFRLDMPGHIKHNHGDTFSEVYLSYYGHAQSSEFLRDFPPEVKFLYRRPIAGAITSMRPAIPKRFIRAYHLRDPQTGREGPWLAGMTLDPSMVCEAWCHQRGYVCMIEEIGGYPIRAGESFGAAFIVGYFNTIEEMNRTYDRYAGNTGLVVEMDGWRLAARS